MICWREFESLLQEMSLTQVKATTESAFNWNKDAVEIEDWEESLFSNAAELFDIKTKDSRMGKGKKIPEF